jgi:predicted GNAT family acetyltransferase
MAVAPGTDPYSTAVRRHSGRFTDAKAPTAAAASMPYALTQKGPPVPSDVTVTNHPERQRYEALAGHTTAGYVEYQETSELVVLTHTEVDPTFEGRGVGRALARAALDDIRERRLKALVVCPFIIGWLRNHPEHQDLLFNAPPSKVSD